MTLYLTYFAVALIGMVLQALLKIKSLQEKARKANVQFKAKEYLIEDWVSHCASLATIVMFLFFIDEFANIDPRVMGFMKIGFAFVGYTGSDIASRLFSVVNRRINDAIDYKTTQADTANGTQDSPTPAITAK
jgi:archaellum biogenesis protein FlaJ (TadC family)